MPKGSEKLTKARREEIVNACDTLYEVMSFKDITIKEIGNVTSFTRTSIYNYFETKEEIFLALLQREYEKWTDDLKLLETENEELTNEEFASLLAKALSKRGNMLKLMAMNLYDIEDNSRMERLVEFKKVYGGSVNEIRNCLNKFCKNMSGDEKDEFILIFLPFVYGIYPYSFATEKQKEAMKQAGCAHNSMSIYDIAFAGIKKLFNK